MPLPEYAAAWARRWRRPAGTEAAEAYELVDAMQRLLEANGARTELETALVDLDRNVNLADALARAREAYAERRSIEAEDVLGWPSTGTAAARRRSATRSARCGSEPATP